MFGALTTRNLSKSKRCSCNSVKRVWKDSKELTHGLHNFSLKYSNSSFTIRVNLCHRWASLFLYGLLLSLWCLSILVNYYFQFSFHLKVLYLAKKRQITLTAICLSKGSASNPTERVLVISPLNSIVQVGFFRVTHEGLSEKGTSRKLSAKRLTGEVISLSVTIFELLLSGQIQSSLAPFSVVLLLLFFSVLNQRQVNSHGGFL